MRRYLPLLRIAHHGTVAVIHLRFFARRGFDHHASFRRGDSALLAHEPLDAVVAPREAVVVHQILPDGHRVAATRQPQFDDFPVGLAGARRGAAAVRLPEAVFRPQGRWPPLWPVLPHSGPNRPAAELRSPPPSDTGGRFPPDVRRSFNAPQRPAEPAQGNHLLFLFFAQDIAHVDGA